MLLSATLVREVWPNSESARPLREESMRSLNRSAMPTIWVAGSDSRVLMAAPVPRPPQPIMPTRTESVPPAQAERAKKGREAAPAVRAAEDLTKSRRVISVVIGGSGEFTTETQRAQRREQKTKDGVWKGEDASEHSAKDAVL